jgi:glycosyltransferase involved in cell wall biosynthesis
MNSASEPLVSVVTPVYNGAPYLSTCINSVLAQTYRNWEHILVDNCSTDETPEILSRYAQRDSRIRLAKNDRFVGVIENHNIAFRLIAPESKYCKGLSADDYLFPECIRKMVDLAERHPNVGIVGSYSIHDEGVHWIGLSPQQSLFEGSEVCRRYLLGAIEAFGTPSSVLYRSSLVSGQQEFYPGPLPNADLAACLIHLESAQFAFVHQILSYERIHADAISSSVHALNGFLTDRLQFVVEYGPKYLKNYEINQRKEQLLRELCQHLAVDAVHLKGKHHWEYQRQRLQALGCSLSSSRMAAAVFMKLVDLLFNPKQTLEKLLKRSAIGPRPNSPTTPN